MVKIRLTRTGRKNSPSYRIVAMESSKKRDGAYLESFGYYNPSKGLDDLKIDKKAIEKWVKNGAQVSDTVKKLIDGTYVYKAYNPNAKEEEEKAKEKEEIKAEEKVEENK